ncbi:transporter substrate-binding domain-containing protein [Ochrobactrum pecoris]|uniref:Transporter substrate-binding domain-containing protein n=2 Tax=Brucella pecoris TaxID=867683 RepID=A0A5C5CU74_9HYPH|nr:transporter substrate-binding domain-containing protein [Brucella pecoris]TNV14697.1 transporter substrate-binding domain-containing protein [Brucella pecoris]
MSLMPVKKFINHSLHRSLLILLLVVISSVSYAQQAPKPVQVGVYVSEPFVNKQGNAYSGMAIDIWQDIATRMNLASQYVEYPNYTELVKAVSEGKVEAAVTNLTITEQRAEIVDFTHPWFDAGLRIMVHTEAGNGWDDLINRLDDAGHLVTYGWILGILIAATVLLTIFDRRFDEGFPKRWREGLAESFHHVVSIATSGKTSRKNLFGWMGRIWQTFWMVFGIAIIAYLTSSITSVMTIAHIDNNISSLSDLQGKSVGVRAGSVAEQFLKSRSIATVPFNHMPEAVNALVSDEIAAIVGDGPVLEYYAHQHADQPVDLVGNIFSPDKYGFAFPRHSELVKPASVAIISAHENEDVAKLKAKYFGPEN